MDTLTQREAEHAAELAALRQAASHGENASRDAKAYTSALEAAMANARIQVKALCRILLAILVLVYAGGHAYWLTIGAKASQGDGGG